MQVSFILLSAAALFYVHVARGVDSDNCKATINGQEVSLKVNDRYCSDDTTSKICVDTNGDGFGDSFKEDKCEPDSKCLKSPTSYNTLCRRIVKNTPDSNAPSGNDQSPPSKPDSPPHPSKPDEPKKQEPTDSAPPRSKPDNKPTQSDQTPQAAPADNKPETCKATINGQEQTLNTGDRYCSDDTNSRVCAYGEWFDFKCPDNSKCLKSPSGWQVLCRIINRNPPQAEHPQDSDAAPAKNEGKPNPRRLRRETAPKVNAVQDAHVDVQAAPSVSDQVETCKATINGQEQTLNTGERYCSDDSTSRVCNYGIWVDFKCPDNSKCLKSPSGWQVLCRIINRNPPQPEHPHDSDVQADNKSPKFKRQVRK